MSWDCGLRYVFMPPVLQLGGVCALRGGGGGVGVGVGGSSGGGMGTCGREELTSRLGLEAVQRLAKDGCRLLQNHNYRLPDRNQMVSRECDDGAFILKSSVMGLMMMFCTLIGVSPCNPRERVVALWLA